MWFITSPWFAFGKWYFGSWLCPNWITWLSTVNHIRRFGVSASFSLCLILIFKSLTLKAGYYLLATAQREVFSMTSKDGGSFVFSLTLKRTASTLACDIILAHLFQVVLLILTAPRISVHVQQVPKAEWKLIQLNILLYYTSHYNGISTPNSWPTFVSALNHVICVWSVIEKVLKKKKMSFLCMGTWLAYAHLNSELCRTLLERL